MNTPRPRPGFPARLPGAPVASAAPKVPMKAPTKAPMQAAVAPNTPIATKTARSAPPSLPAAAPATGLGLDSQAARAAMVRKIAAQGGGHAQVLQAMGAVERHRFVDSALANQAYEDTSLPIGLGQTISKPSVVARMLALMLAERPAPLGRVLEIGTGCGYQAAVLARLATEVYSIERLRGLHEKARHNLRPLRIPNLHLLLGDGMLGYPAGGPYAAIVAAAGGEAIPAAWTEQLALGGRLIAPAHQSGGRQHLVVVEKTPRGLVQTVLEPVLFVPLKSGVV